MALADYRLCDRCEGKAFFDARLSYSDDGLPVGAGDMKVLCERCAETHEVIVREKSGDEASQWRPIETGSDEPEYRYIDVRHVTGYRWVPYKPDGRRQMKKPGRWQRATEYGWENDELPEGEWRPIKGLGKR